MANCTLARPCPGCREIERQRVAREARLAREAQRTPLPTSLLVAAERLRFQRGLNGFPWRADDGLRSAIDDVLAAIDAAMGGLS